MDTLKEAEAKWLKANEEWDAARTEFRLTKDKMEGAYIKWYNACKEWHEARRAHEAEEASGRKMDTLLEEAKAVVALHSERLGLVEGSEEYVFIVLHEAQHILMERIRKARRFNIVADYVLEKAGFKYNPQGE